MDPRTEAINAEVSRQAAEAESRHAAICERLGPMSSSVWPYVVRPHVERQVRERAAWARLLRAQADLCENGGPMCSCDKEGNARKAAWASAKRVLRDLGVDVDALVTDPVGPLGEL